MAFDDDNYDDYYNDGDTDFNIDDFTEDDITDLDQLWEFAYDDYDSFEEYEFHGTGDTGG